MKNILYIAQFKDAAGYGNAARGYLKLFSKFLDKNKFNLKIFSINFEKKDYSTGEYVSLIDKYSLNKQELIHFINNNKYTLFLHSLPTFYKIDNEEMPINRCLLNKNCEKKINLISWETDKCPEEWRQIYTNNIFDILCVSCSWNKNIFEKDLNMKIKYIPLSIHDYFELEKNKKTEKFTIFSMSQWQHRKGFDILARSYYQEFFDQDDVELIIKTYRNEASGANEELEKKAIISDILKYKNECLHYGKIPTCKIALKTGICSTEEIKALYEKADVFCLPTRGEGFGMTIAQAALSGVPCIVPNLGGHTDFIDSSSNYLIDSSYESLYGLQFHAYSSKDMNLVEPSISSTRKKLRQAYNDWKSSSLIEKALISKKYCQDKLNELSIYNQIIGLIND